MRISGIFSIVVLSISFAVVGSEIPADKDIIVFPGKLGDVTFNHKLHSGLENVVAWRKWSAAPVTIPMKVRVRSRHAAIAMCAVKKRHRRTRRI